MTEGRLNALLRAVFPQFPPEEIDRRVERLETPFGDVYPMDWTRFQAILEHIVACEKEAREEGRREGRKEGFFQAAQIADRTEIFPMPRNRILVENMRHTIAGAIRAKLASEGRP